MIKSALIFILFFSSALLHAEEFILIWQSPDKGVSQFLDASTIQRDGDLVRMSRIFNYLPPYLRRVNRRPYTSQRVVTEFNCKKMQVRQLSADWHEGDMGSGDILNKENQADVWEAVTHDVFTEPLWKIACENKEIK